MILSCNDIHRAYQQGDTTLHILKGINFNLKAGEIVALIGASGSGKSTFLQIAGLLEKPSSGIVEIDGQNIINFNDSELTKLRRSHLGFIYQFHHLLPEFSALENVMIPLLMTGISKRIAQSKAEVLLDKIGLSHRLTHSTKKLSGGEQQRIAIARALVRDPKILLADEPTGNLDNDTANTVFTQLMHMIRTQNLAAIIATHDLALAKKMDRIVHLHNGIIEEVTA
ncbi:MAG: ABC transporter ATP-binding protein [Candidatus Paracaedibacteraceae bacterium]|nr:ABC transporter ATP-binding protein [Candidatus Paracaedibacteraceae bacterium]